MKKYLIRAIVTHYTPVGAHEYALEYPVWTETISQESAAQTVIDFLLRGGSPESKTNSLRKFLRSGSVFIPHLCRIVAAVSWEDIGEETESISITVSDGLIENIAGIPEGYHVEVRDWDASEIDEYGETVPEVTVWEHDGQWAPGCH
jgi:hypothetical protein